MAPAPPTPPTADSGAEKAGAGAPASSGTPAAEGIPVFDIEIGTYAEMEQIAERIASEAVERVAKKNETVLFFFLDDALREALDLHPLVMLQISNLVASYRGAEASAERGLRSLTRAVVQDITLEAVGPQTVTETVSAAISSAVSLFGALRGDDRFSGKGVTIATHAFALSLGRYVQMHKDVAFHYPTLFLPLSAGDSAVLREVVAGIQGMNEARDAAALRIEKLAVAVSALQSTDPLFPEAKAALDSARDGFHAAESIREEFQMSMTRADAKTGLSRLQLLERAGHVQKLLAQHPDRCYFLFAQITAAGGSFVSSNGLIAWIAGRASRYAAGVVATYGLFRFDGSLVVSRTLGSRSEYRNAFDARVF